MLGRVVWAGTGWVTYSLDILSYIIIVPDMELRNSKSRIYGLPVNFYDF
jgi:hypothetical protein